MAERFDAVVIGAGTAGLSTSRCLVELGVAHLVVERGRVGEAWRSARWDGFHLVTPNWSIRLPGAEYAGPDPDSFMARADFVRYLEDWATRFGAPVREGVTVRRTRFRGGSYLLETDAGAIEARNLVVASGGYQRTRRPAWAAGLAGRIYQLDADRYRNPAALPAGAVLVVGSGQSGTQIAEKLNRAGRRTWLSLGRTGRLPRRYRGRDSIAWQRDMGYLDRTPAMLEHPRDRFRGDPMLSGAGGGHVLSLHDLARDGVGLIGRAVGRAEPERLVLDPDLAENMAFADAFAADIMAKFDAHMADAGISAPPATAEELTGGPPADFVPPAAPEALDLRAAGITTILWATSHAFDFSWIEGAPLDTFGFPRAPPDRAPEGALHFVGQNWLRRRGSGILWGVGRDARLAADAIAARLGI